MPTQQNPLIISEYVLFRMKRANPDASVLGTFFDVFPSGKWDIALISPQSYGLHIKVTQKKL